MALAARSMFSPGVPPELNRRIVNEIAKYRAAMLARPVGGVGDE